MKKVYTNPAFQIEVFTFEGILTASNIDENGLPDPFDDKGEEFGQP